MQYDESQHRDVHQAVTKRGAAPKIADLGMARRLAEGRSHVTDARPGSSFYTAPEVQSSRQLRFASDVYSFGVIMWELLAGRTVYVPACATLSPRRLSLAAPACATVPNARSALSPRGSACPVRAALTQASMQAARGHLGQQRRLGRVVPVPHQPALSAPAPAGTTDVCPDDEGLPQRRPRRATHLR